MYALLSDIEEEKGTDKNMNISFSEDNVIILYDNI
jgi:hypothetical protein